jgi:hypothetical protein
MFDKKIEPVAQKYIRAKLVLEEAEQAVDLAKEQLMALIPQGSKYVTKDGESIAHINPFVRRTYVAEKLAKLLTPRIWRAVRIDAIDKKKLDAFIAAGEVDITKIADGIEETPVRSSLRVTWPSIRPIRKAS